MEIVLDPFPELNPKGWESHKKKDEIGVAEMGGVG
jgi:hypothetical protein